MTLLYDADRKEADFRRLYGDYYYTLNDQDKTITLPKKYFTFVVVLRALRKENVEWVFTGLDRLTMDLTNADFVPVVAVGSDSDEPEFLIYTFIFRPARLLEKGKKHTLEFVLRLQEEPHTIKYKFKLYAVYK